MITTRVETDAGSAGLSNESTEEEEYARREQVQEQQVETGRSAIVALPVEEVVGVLRSGAAVGWRVLRQILPLLLYALLSCHGGRRREGEGEEEEGKERECCERLSHNKSECWTNAPYHRQLPGGRANKCSATTMRGWVVSCTSAARCELCSRPVDGECDRVQPCDAVDVVSEPAVLLD